jgi:predicted ATP-binding protein involved in virulence
LVLENYGPFINTEIQFRFNKERLPLPTIFIGKNGSGKTILLSQIINALCAAQGIIYENSEVKSGKVYKLRSPLYIRNGEYFWYTKLNFTAIQQELVEYQLRETREDIEKNPEFKQPHEDWSKILPKSETSLFLFPISVNDAKKIISQQCVLYFPTNRFELPAWLNDEDLIKPVKYQDLKHLASVSNRTMIATSTLKDCQNWLLDVLLDMGWYEKKPVTLPSLNENNGEIIKTEYSGIATTIWGEVNKLINVIFSHKSDKKIQLRFTDRKNRQFDLSDGEKVLVPNLFQLSTGEVLLLDMFLSIVRDFDLTGEAFKSLSDIVGIVLIDEIDVHLHTTLQQQVLPKLLKLFPKIQFVITTHSPLFLLGMQETFGSDNFNVLELPEGNSIDVESFSEFKDMFAVIEETTTYRKKIIEQINENIKPAVFVEGDYDVRYIKRALKLLYP